MVADRGYTSITINLCLIIEGFSKISAFRFGVAVFWMEMLG